MRWKDMDGAAREAAFVQRCLTDGISYSEFGAEVGLSKSAVSGWAFRRNNPEISKAKVKSTHDNGRWTDNRLTRKWTPKPKAVAAKALEGIKKQDFIWPEEMRQKFIRMYKDGVQYKIIAHELNVSVSACKNMRAAMGLEARRGRAGRRRASFKGGRLHLNLKQDEHSFIARKGPRNGITMNDYIRGLIRKEMDHEVQVQELQG